MHLGVPPFMEIPIWWISWNLRSFGRPPNSQFFPGREQIFHVFPISLYTFILQYILGMVKDHLHIINVVFAIWLCHKSSQNTSTSAQFSSGHSAWMRPYWDGVTKGICTQTSQTHICNSNTKCIHVILHVCMYIYIYTHVYTCVYACMIVSV